MVPPLPTSKFVGMASYGPTCFLDIMDDDVGSLSQECAMTDAPEQPLGATESSRTHASPGPHTETSELTREHEEELQRQWPHQPPTMPARSARYAAPRARGPANGARGHARQVHLNTTDRGTDPPQFARASQNIAAATMLLRGLSEPNDPRERAIHQNLRALLETVVVQQAECSVSRR